MEIGFNNDVVYRGTTFHIQTEDHGGADQKVSTQLFFRGAILDTRTVSYANLIRDIAEDEERKDKIRKVMVKSHRSLYKRLFNGEYDAKLGDSLREGPSSRSAMVDPEEFEPKQERVPEVAKVVEEDGKVTFTFDHGDQIDLEALSRQLSEIDIYGDRDGGGGGVVGDFDNLFAEFGATPDKPAAQARAAAAAPASQTQPQIIYAAAPQEPVKVTWNPTGKRAFQGLIEPPPDMRILDMVRELLNSSR